MQAASIAVDYYTIGLAADVPPRPDPEEAVNFSNPTRERGAKGKHRRPRSRVGLVLRD